MPDNTADRGRSVADEWIKMRHALHHDPAVIRMSVDTGLDVYAVIGRLHRVWSWADQHTADGRIEGVPAEWVDGYVGHPGFAAAMESAGWLEVDGPDLALPHFTHHNGVSAKRRALDARRKADARRTNVREVSASDADRMRTRGEEIREEKEQESAAPPLVPETEQTAEKEEAPTVGDQIAQEFAEWCGMSLASVGGYGRSIVREIRKCPIDGADDLEVWRACRAVAESVERGEPRAAARRRDCVVGLVRRAIDDGALPEVYERTRETYAERDRRETLAKRDEQTRRIAEQLRSEGIE